MIKNLVRSAGAIASGQVLNVVGNLALVPLLLSRWSSAVTGEWMALSALVLYLGTLDMGMNAAAGNSLLAAYAQKDMGRYRSLQASSLAFYIFLASAVTALVGLACLLLPVSRLMGITHIPSRAGSLIVWALVARLMWQMPAAQIWNIHRTTGDLAASQWLWNLQLLGSLVVTALAIQLGGGPTDAAIWAILPLIATAAAAWYSVHRRHPNLLPHFSAASRQQVRLLLAPSLYFGLITIAVAITLNGPVVLVSRALGGVAVALLVTTRTLTNVARMVMTLLTNSLWPELTRLNALGGEGESLRQAHRIVAAAATALSSAFAATLWFEGPSIMAYWTRGLLTCNQSLLRLFLITVLLQTPWATSSILSTATNQHRRFAIQQMASALLTLTAVALLLPAFGTLAVPLGTILGEGLACYHFVVRDACNTAGENYASYAKRAWTALLVAFGAACLSSWLLHQTLPSPQPIRWLCSGIAAITITTATVAVFLRKSDRTAIMHQLNCIVHQSNHLSSQGGYTTACVATCPEPSFQHTSNDNQ